MNWLPNKSKENCNFTILTIGYIPNYFVLRSITVYITTTFDLKQSVQPIAYYLL